MITRDDLMGMAAARSAEATEALEGLDQAAADASTPEVASQLAEAICGELAALRFTIEAAVLPEERVDALPAARWVRLELMGHSSAYGLLVETEVAGRTFLELVQPAVTIETNTAPVEWETIREESRKLYHPNAVYALQDIGEEHVMDALRRQCGLFRHPDGSWQTEPAPFDLDREALAARGVADDDEIPF